MILKQIRSDAQAMTENETFVRLLLFAFYPRIRIRFYRSFALEVCVDKALFLAVFAGGMAYEKQMLAARFFCSN